MKKFILKLMPLILLFGLITCCPSFTTTAKAYNKFPLPGEGPAATVFDFRVLGYGFDRFYERYETADVSEDEFPMLIETCQWGYGNCYFSLDNSSLSSSEYSEYKAEPLYNPRNPSSKVVSGWDKVWIIKPNSNKLYNGTHTLKVVCNGISGNSMSDSVSFRINR